MVVLIKWGYRNSIHIKAKKLMNLFSLLPNVIEYFQLGVHSWPESPDLGLQPIPYKAN